MAHGIRFTAMPAWRDLLSERDVALVAAVVARFGTEVDPVAAVARGG